MDLGLFLFEGCADWEVAPLLSQLQAVAMSVQGGLVRTASGLTIATEPLRKVDLLVVPSDAPDEVYDGPVARVDRSPLEFAREVLIRTGRLTRAQAEAWYDLHQHEVVRPAPGADRPAAQLPLSPLAPGHWPEVARIYAEGMADGAGLETTVPSWEEWDAAHLPHSRFVALDHGRVAGWVAAAAVEGGCCYRGVAELSVYVAGQDRGRGVGRLLLEALLRSLAEHGFWTVQAQIIRENVGSLTLHRQAGFRIVGVRESIGRREGRWHDVVLLEARLSSEK